MDEEGKRLLRLIRRAIDERSYLLNISDVLGYSVGFREKNGKRTDEPVLVVYVRKGRKGKKPDDFPHHQRIPRKIRLNVDNKTVWLGIDLIESEVGKLCGTASDPGVITQILPGYGAYNINSPNN
jgi:hypothetical protein